MDNLSYFNLF